MARAVASILLLASACAGPVPPPELVAEPPVTLTDSELNTPVLPATTTTQPESVATLPPRNSGIVESSTTLPDVSLPYNGWAIPEYIVACETGGTFSWTAYNPSGASGPYQIMPEWFNGQLAMNQSHASQHAMAAKIWNDGKGRNNWKDCL